MYMGEKTKVAALKADPQLSQLDCVKNERFVRLSLEDAHGRENKVIYLNFVRNCKRDLPIKGKT